jgi:hypothetical protein
MENKTPGWIWLFVLLIIYVLGISIFVANIQNTTNLEKIIISERTMNSVWFGNLDAEMWQNAHSGGVFSGLAEVANAKIVNASEIIQGKKGVLENLFHEAPLRISLYAALLDYRLGMFVSLLPTMGFLFIAVLADAFAKRKIAGYQNSFTSPLRHHLGGKILGFHSALLVLALFLLPFNLPFYIFIALVAVKTVGWWLWLVNLPKRI